MKKTIKINLQGAVFHLDEDAYALLQEYLTRIGERFASKEERQEIIQDIEIRIAEIFTDRLAGKREVVSRDDVEKMIGLLGRPEDIGESGEEFSSPAGAEGSSSPKGHKRLYRDPENAVLGGVCGGLGAYFNLDPVWFRVGFILLTLVYGASVLLYLLLWLILPEARTTIQRLEMMGEPVNLQNISKNVEKGVGKFRDDLKRFPESETYRRSASFVRSLWNSLAEILEVLVRITVILAGILFLFTGMVLLVAFLFSFVFNVTSFLPWFIADRPVDMTELLGVFIRPENIPYFIGTLLLTLGIPMAALIYLGIKMIFRLRGGHPLVGVTFFVIWLFSAVTFGFFVANVLASQETHTLTTEVVPLSLPPGDTLYVSSFPPPMQIHEIAVIEDEWVGRNDSTGMLAFRPLLQIVPSGGDRPELEILRRAGGPSRRAARLRAEAIRVTWLYRDRHLQLGEWFEDGEVWRGEQVTFRLRLPQGTVLCLDPGVREIISSYIPNAEDLWGDALAGRCWRMGKEKLYLFTSTKAPQ